MLFRREHQVNGGSLYHRPGPRAEKTKLSGVGMLRTLTKVGGQSCDVDLLRDFLIAFVPAPSPHPCMDDQSTQPAEVAMKGDSVRG